METRLLLSVKTCDPELHSAIGIPHSEIEEMVPATGLEPVRCYSLEPESR